MPLAADRFVRGADHHLLDLVELVDAVQAGRVLARTARLAAEAGAHRGVAQGQRFRVNDLVHVVRHQPDLAGAGEGEAFATSGGGGGVGDVVDLFAAVGEEPGAHERRMPHEAGRGERGEAHLAGHQVERITQYGLMQAHPVADEDIAAAARDLHAPGEIDKV